MERSPARVVAQRVIARNEVVHTSAKGPVLEVHEELVADQVTLRPDRGFTRDRGLYGCSVTPRQRCGTLMMPSKTPEKRGKPPV